MMPERIEAARLGKLSYVGQPCKRHGDALRYVSNGHCIQCGLQSQRNAYARTRAELSAVKMKRGLRVPPPGALVQEQEFSDFDDTAAMREAKLIAAANGLTIHNIREVKQQLAPAKPGQQLLPPPDDPDLH